MRYVQGVNRNQTLLLPETLDKYVPPESPVRVENCLLGVKELLVLLVQKA